MNYKLTFKIVNSTYSLMRITQLFSRVQCKITEFNANQIEQTNLLTVTIHLYIDERKMEQLNQIFNSKIGVVDFKFNKLEKVLL